jgi:hypothetical protein
VTIVTKFWRTKLATVATSVAAMILVWGALAWPDWTSTKAAPYNADKAAWEWMASLTPEQRETLIKVANEPAAAAPPAQPVAAEPPPVIVQHVTIVRHIPAGTTPADAPSQSAVSDAPAAAPPPQQEQVTAPPAPKPTAAPARKASAPAPAPAAPAPAPAPAPPPAASTKAS